MRFFVAMVTFYITLNSILLLTVELVVVCVLFLLMISVFVVVGWLALVIIITTTVARFVEVGSTLVTWLFLSVARFLVAVLLVTTLVVLVGSLIAWLIGGESFAAGLVVVVVALHLKSRLVRSC